MDRVWSHLINIMVFYCRNYLYTLLECDVYSSV